VGIKDVAREAGVSTTTVSHALSGKGRLPEETRVRVRRIAEEMGYRPSAVARSLAAGRTGVLGIAFSVHPNVEANFFALDWYAQIVNGATDRAMQAGYALVVVPPTAGPQIWGRLPLDGTIVVEPVPDDPSLSEIAAYGVRLVSIGTSPGLDAWAVDNDNAAVVREALDHLRDAGARSVALASFAWPTAWREDAIATYRAWSAEIGADPLVVELREIDDAPAAYARLLDDAGRRDAVLCTYERLGYELLEAARDRGIRVPDDFLIVASGDEGRAATTDPPLTTIDFDAAALGAASAGMLVDLVEGREPAARTTLVPARLVVRGSSSPPPA
jgi:DNA-binding LacI/PurR family transcriptional regulator